MVVRVPVGTTYTATLTGTDAEGHALTLTAQGQDFDLTSVGMRFAAQNGPGQAAGQFQWQATCEATLSPQPLTVAFALQESGPCNPQRQARTVQFLVVPAADTLAFLPPNIITPNGDGKNDFFELPQLPPDLCEGHFAGVRIYSRWGREVYHSPARTLRWAGPGMAGTYYYLLTYTDGRRYKGWLEVVP